MRVRHVDVDEVGEIEAEVGGAGHVLHGDAVHVVAQSREVLRLREQLGQLVKGALVLQIGESRLHVFLFLASEL